MNVIHCPCESHKQDKTHNRPDGSVKKIAPIEKVLVIVPKATKGAVSVQCSDTTCRTYNKKHSDGKYNSWYCIEFNGLGAYKVTPIPIPKKRWKIDIVPVSIMEAN